MLLGVDCKKEQLRKFDFPKLPVNRRCLLFSLCFFPAHGEAVLRIHISSRCGGNGFSLSFLSLSFRKVDKNNWRASMLNQNDYVKPQTSFHLPQTWNQVMREADVSARGRGQEGAAPLDSQRLRRRNQRMADYPNPPPADRPRRPTKDYTDSQLPDSRGYFSGYEDETEDDSDPRGYARKAPPRGPPSTLSKQPQQGQGRRQHLDSQQYAREPQAHDVYHQRQSAGNAQRPSQQPAWEPPAMRTPAYPQHRDGYESSGSSIAAPTPSYGSRSDTRDKRTARRDAPNAFSSAGPVVGQMGPTSRTQGGANPMSHQFVPREIPPAREGARVSVGGGPVELLPAGQLP